MKPPLLILHGAIGASVQLKAIATLLSPNYSIHLLDFPGHGGSPLPAEPFSIQLFAEAAKNYIETQHLTNLTIFGYSMGGYVALYLAKEFPLERIITLGTKFHWDEATAAKETKMLNPSTITAKVPAFAAALEALHAPTDWKTVLEQTADMMERMGRDKPLDYASIKAKCLIMLGDRDKMVTFEETLAVYKQLPDAAMAVLPDTPHMIDQVDPVLIAYLINKNNRLG